MSTPAAHQVSPYPDWELRIYQLTRPVKRYDIQAFLGDQDAYIRDTAAGPVHTIHKYGLLEIHARVGEKGIEVWYNPEQGSYPLEYFEALLATRF
ncbi:MAG TPA: hypothetical protein PLE57_09530 [Methanoregulaceae archaeon]|nr:hypothetical protein [Methanoregulaceae archaeon]